MTLFTTRPARGDSPSNIFEFLDNTERMAREALNGLGEPTDLADWFDQPVGSARRYDDLVSFSDARRAVDALIECRNVRRAIEAGDAALAAWNTAYLVTGLDHWTLDSYEQPLRHGASGLKKLEDARSARKSAVTSADLPDIKAEIDRLCQDSKMSITAIREKIGAHFGVQEKRIRELTNNYNPRK